MWKPSGITEGDNFALRMMKKQGWSQGEGLGKNGGGIAEPLRPSLKFDSSGVGHDPAKEFTSNWWEQAYKKAADKIQITQGEEEAQIKTVRKLDKKTIERQKREAKNKLYSQFVQSATLTNGILEESSKSNSGNASSDSSDTDDEEEDKFKRLTDEELFKACGGLTAHKGARHGHKMSAKMKRIEDQEKELLNQMKKSYGVSEKAQKSETSRKRNHEEKEEVLAEEPIKKKAKKSKKEKRRDEVTENGKDSIKDSRVESLQSEDVENTETVKKKKKSKKDDEAPLEIVESSDVALPADAESNAKKKKKKAKKSKKKESSDRDEAIKEQPAPETCENVEPPKKKKKKKKKEEKD